MACSPITAYNYPCSTNQGGIQGIWLGLFSEPLSVMTFTYGTGSNVGVITTLGGATMSFVRVAQRPEQGSATYTDENGANGLTSVLQTIEVTLEQLDGPTTNLKNTITQGRWRAIVLDALGNYSMYGVKKGLDHTAGSGGAGKAVADTNKAIITLTGKEPLMPAIMTSAAALSVIS